MDDILIKYIHDFLNSTISRPSKMQVSCESIFFDRECIMSSPGRCHCSCKTGARLPRKSCPTPRSRPTKQSTAPSCQPSSVQFCFCCIAGALSFAYFAKRKKLNRANKKYAIKKEERWESGWEKKPSDLAIIDQGPLRLFLVSWLIAVPAKSQVSTYFWYCRELCGNIHVTVGFWTFQNDWLSECDPWEHVMTTDI